MQFNRQRSLSRRVWDVGDGSLRRESEALYLWLDCTHSRVAPTIGYSGVGSAGGGGGGGTGGVTTSGYSAGGGAGLDGF